MLRCCMGDVKGLAIQRLIRVYVFSVSLPPGNKAIPPGLYFNVISTTLNA